MKLPHLLLVAMVATFLGCSESDRKTDADEHSHTEGQQVAKGPHGGRLLKDGDFTAEIAIFERGVPPEFRVFFFEGDKPLKPEQVRLEVELARFGGRIDRFAFAPREDYLLGDGEVEEPHSFDVTVRAEAFGRRHEWRYQSYEGRTSIVAAMAADAGVAIDEARPRKLLEKITLHGLIDVDPARQRAVGARYAGVIQSVRKQVGESVRAGETVAVVESNESLQTYNIVAPIAGVVTQRRANAGETTGSEALFEIADFSRVRAELTVFPRDFARLRKGQAAKLRSTDGKLTAFGSLDYLGTNGNARTPQAHVLIDNKGAQWTPGLFVAADVVVGERTVPLAVPLTAIQKFRDWDVVFLNDGETYQAMPVELGDNDGEIVEIKNGLKQGDRLVIRNSYLIKADIEKSGASHDH